MFWANFALALAAGFMVSQVATFATTIYLHRCATHNAFELPLWLHRVFRSLIWLTTGQKTKLWVAVHRKHHANSDHDGDPHSPLIFGFMKVQLLNWLLYYRETQNPITIEKYGRGVYEERLDRVLFNRGLLGIGTGIAILCYALGLTWGLVAAATHVVLYVGILTSCVNAIGHKRVWGGYQNYHRADVLNTFNYHILGWVTGGEGFHNNHHHQPQSAYLGHRTLELDPARPVIKFLARMGWATKIQEPIRSTV